MILLLSSSSVGNGDRNGRSGNVSSGAGRMPSTGSVSSAAGDRNGNSGTPTAGNGRD